MTAADDEHALLLIKPDGVTQGIEPLVLSLLAGYELVVVRRREFVLTRRDVDAWLSKPNPEYTQYLASGPCIALLVRGAYAAAHLARIKKAVRKEFGLSWRDMRNLVHHSEPGREHAEQLSLCFPGVEPLRYSGYADLDVRCSLRQLIALDGSSTLRWAAVARHAADLTAIADIVERYYDRPARRLDLVGAVVQVSDLGGHRIELVAYFPASIPLREIGHRDCPPLEARDFIRWATTWGGTTAIGLITGAAQPASIASNAIEIGVRSIVACHPAYSSEDSHQLADLANDLDVPVVGGSSGTAIAGSYSVGRFEFDALWNQFPYTPKRTGWCEERNVVRRGRIAGECSTLRPAETADIDRLVDWRADKELTRFWDDEVTTKQDIELRLSRPHIEPWIIESGVGPVGYLEVSERGIELFLVPSACGKGVGTDAVRAMAIHLLEHGSHPKVTIDIFAWNTRAIRAFHKAGFVEVARRADRGAERIKLEYRDHHRPGT